MTTCWSSSDLDGVLLILWPEDISNKSERKKAQGEQETYIFMFHVLQQPQLSVGPLCKDLGLKGPVQLLDGHFLFGFVIDD